MKLTILSTEGAQDSEFHSFFGRIQYTLVFHEFCTASWAPWARANCSNEVSQEKLEHDLIG